MGEENFEEKKSNITKKNIGKKSSAELNTLLNPLMLVGLV